MHEGGELGYSLVHAFGAAFDNPDLIVACVVGDGEAETCPLEGSWKGIKFLNPARDGAVLPILHLNGYKISGPTVEARTSDEELARLLQRPRLHAVFRRRRRSRIRAPAIRRMLSIAATQAFAKFRSPRAQKLIIERNSVIAAMADDRSAHAQRLDVPERSRRRADRRHLPRTPSSAIHRLRKSRASENAGSLDAQIQARKIIR